MSAENLSQGIQNQYLELSDNMPFLSFQGCFLFCMFPWNVQKYQIMIVPNSRWKFGAFAWYSSVFRGSESLPRGRSKVGKRWIFSEKKQIFKNPRDKSEQTVRSESYTTFSGKFYNELEEIQPTQKEH